MIVFVQGLINFFFESRKKNVFSKPLYLPKRQMRLTDDSSFEISLFVFPPFIFEINMGRNKCVLKPCNVLLET